METKYVTDVEQSKSTNPWTRMRESIIGRYADQNHLIQQRAWFLFILYLGFIVIQTVGTVAQVAAGIHNMNILRSYAISVVLAIIVLFFVRAKRYTIAANIGLIGFVLNLTIGIYFSANIQVFFVTVMYYTGALILYANLFCDRKAVLLTTVWFSAVVVICYMNMEAGVSQEMQVMIKKGFFNALVSLWTIAYFSLMITTIMNRSNANLVESVSDVRESSAKLTEIANVVDTSSRDLSNGTSAQAAAMEETSSSLKEILQGTKENTNIVLNAEKLMQQTTETINITNDTLKELKQSMDEVNEASIKTARIVKDIDSIAFQTNLLALNAAVEAARAGEAGAGFAVVADEVRRLALKSKEASRTTQDIIGGNIENIKKSAALAVRSYEAFSMFNKVAEQLAADLKVIAASSQEQTQGIAEIEKAIEDINNVIQSNAASAEESSAVSTELTHMSYNIDSFVQKLDRLVTA